AHGRARDRHRDRAVLHAPGRRRRAHPGHAPHGTLLTLPHHPVKELFIMAVPVGYVITVAPIAGCAALALMPLRRPPILAALTFRLTLAVNELPFIACFYLAAATVLVIGQHDVASPGGWAALGLGVLTMAGLGVIAWRGLQTGPV